MVCIPHIPCLGRQILYHWAAREAKGRLGFWKVWRTWGRASRNHNVWVCPGSIGWFCSLSLKFQSYSLPPPQDPCLFPDPFSCRFLRKQTPRQQQLFTPSPGCEHRPGCSSLTREGPQHSQNWRRGWREGRRLKLQGEVHHSLVGRKTLAREDWSMEDLLLLWKLLVSVLWELILFSLSAVSSSLWPYGLQPARFHCPSLPLRLCSNSCPLSWWFLPIIASSVALFSSWNLWLWLIEIREQEKKEEDTEDPKVSWRLWGIQEEMNLVAFFRTFNQSGKDAARVHA